MLDDLPWLPKDLVKSLLAITSFLRKAFGPELSYVGLFGSWQRGEAMATSDVDIVLFLKDNVLWFDGRTGQIDPAMARKERLRWHEIEQQANAQRLDSRSYSITVATPAMLAYYKSSGPPHLQNWAHAVLASYPLWSAN
jgi:hypothetical protein